MLKREFTILSMYNIEYQFIDIWCYMGCTYTKLYCMQANLKADAMWSGDATVLFTSSFLSFFFLFLFHRLFVLFCVLLLLQQLLLFSTISPNLLECVSAMKGNIILLLYIDIVSHKHDQSSKLSTFCVCVCEMWCAARAR